MTPIRDADCDRDMLQAKLRITRDAAQEALRFLRLATESEERGGVRAESLVRCAMDALERIPTA